MKRLWILDDRWILGFLAGFLLGALLVHFTFRETRSGARRVIQYSAPHRTERTTLKLDNSIRI